jgi:hypothetical protein
MNARPHLHVVDTSSGEVQEGCPSCDALKDQLAGANKDIAAWRSRYALLKREKDAKAREHEHWAVIEGLFDEWKVECRHPKSKFTPDDFWLCLPFFQEHGRHMCRLAILGAAFDCFKTRRANGSVKRHDGWELIFRDRAKTEEFVNRAPRNASTVQGKVDGSRGAAGVPSGTPAPTSNWGGAAQTARPRHQEQES